MVCARPLLFFVWGLDAIGAIDAIDAIAAIGTIDAIGWIGGFRGFMPQPTLRWRLCFGAGAVWWKVRSLCFFSISGFG